MFTTMLQKVSFVLGCFFLVAAGLSQLQHLAAGNAQEVFVATPIWLGVTALFWHFTGVLTPVLTWFKGK